MTEECRCGSEKPSDECCELIISGKRIPETAEELMRSRYVAYTMANIDYLMRTQLASTRPNKNRAKIKKWAQSVQWLDLAIVSVSGGLPEDDKGTVIFKAFYIEKESYEQIYEDASFKKQNGKWIYVNGVDLDFEYQEKLFSRE